MKYWWLILILLLLPACIKEDNTPPDVLVSTTSSTNFGTVVVNSTNTRLSFRLKDDRTTQINYSVYINYEKKYSGSVINGTYNGIDIVLPYQISNRVTLVAYDKAGNKGYGTIIVNITDIRPPEINLGVVALGTNKCKVHIHIEKLPFETSHTYEIVTSNYTNTGGIIINRTIKPEVYDSDFWSGSNISKVYIELGDNTNIIKLTAIKPKPFFTSVEIESNNISLNLSKSYINWC